MPAFKRFNERAIGERSPYYCAQQGRATFHEGRAAERDRARVKKDKRKAKHKKAAAGRGRRTAKDVAGKPTLQEFLWQPDTWINTPAPFQQNGELAKPFQHFSPEGLWLFVACGSGY